MRELGLGAAACSEGEDRLNIGVLSGKGGTGKTTVSTNLSVIMDADYIDCDVEEPNGFIFLNPEDIKAREVMVDYPYVDYDKCKLCGECVKTCQFNALAKVKEEIILFEKICHSCGACEIACKSGALSYKKRPVGVIEEGRSEDRKCKRGVLNVGEPTAVPVIRQLLDGVSGRLNIIDCAPGTSCNVVSSLQYVDAALLVTEPTEFGLHDLKMAVKLVRMFGIPFGVVINKDVPGENRIQKYCQAEGIPVFGTIPYDRCIAEEYSDGKMLARIDKFKEIFESIAYGVKGALMWSL